MKKIFFLLFLALFLNAKEFKVASYNVENLFDLNHDKTEYQEFIPNTSSNWNQKIFNIKLNNAIKVIEDIDADIIGLQEIENDSLIKLLSKKLPKYKYYAFTKYPNSSVGVGFLSKINIKTNQHLDVRFTEKVFRPILETTFELDNMEFKIFNNHWPSKATSESYRVKYAKTLQDRLKELPSDYDYILLGDFNSDYNEMQTFTNNKKLNNTSGITGINHILNTIIDDKYVTYDDVLKSSKKVHFNLWLELPSNDRFSSKYKTQNNTPDNMILSPALLDTKKISYIPNSFEVFKPSYLFSNNKVKRWEMGGSKNNEYHKGEGFSDHLPILAKFSTSKEQTNPIKQIEKDEKKVLDKISDLYSKTKLIEPANIKDIVVIYKQNDSAIVKQKNDRAIFVYKGAKDLKLGFSYDLEIQDIVEFNGLKEVKKFAIIKENEEIKDYKSMYLSDVNADFTDPIYQNEIITNLKGIIQKGKLYTNQQSINLYAKDKNLLPKDGEEVEFNSVHLGTFKGNIQLIIYSLDDYKVLN